MSILQYFHLSVFIFVRYYWIKSSEDLQCIINKQQWEVFQIIKMKRKKKTENIFLGESLILSSHFYTEQ